jgi:hypothetical protein
MVEQAAKEGEMAAERSTSRASIVRIAVFAGLALVAAQSAAHLIAALAFGSYHSVFDLDRSNGIPDVLSVVVIAAGALGAAVLSSRDRAGRL